MPPMAQKERRSDMSEEKKGVGRPTVMTKSVLRKLEFAYLKGLTDAEACLYANIGTSTLYDYCNAHPEFAERKELLKKNPVARAKINVAEKIEKGDIEASKWYLERRAKDEFSTKQEISGDVKVRKLEDLL